MTSLLRLGPLAIALLLSSVAACSDDETAGVGTTGAGATGATGGVGGGVGGSGAGASGGASGGASTGGDGGTGGEGPPSKRVFVSSETFDGAFGGVAGGHAECQALADAEGLGGTWLAWMSDTLGASPLTTFTPSSDPYVLVGGDTIADDFADLIDGTLAAPIDRDETGAPIGATTDFVWTGTEANGESITPCCIDWSGTSAGAGVGVPTEATSEWSFTGGQPCNMVARLYCFEQ